MPDGNNPPSELLRALGQRGWSLTVVGSAPAVIGALSAEPQARVLLVEPSRLPRVGELVEAVRTYYPGATLMHCAASEDSMPELKEWVGQLTDEGGRDPESEKLPRLVRPDDEPDVPLITDDELSMLLGPVPEDDLDP